MSRESKRTRRSDRVKRAHARLLDRGADVPRIHVVVGAGGVGKTTLSAALALAAARTGRRALVCTIDPARRLVDALQVGRLGDEPVRVPEEVLADAGVEVPGEGALFAAELDVHRTWDRLLHHAAPTPDVADSLMENRLYQRIVDGLSGSIELVAMERLYELAEEETYDTIVLDTPPGRHALDALSAPDDLLANLDSGVLKLLGGMGRRGLGLAARGAKAVLDRVARMIGGPLLEDVGNFARSFHQMAGGLRERAEGVQELIADPDATGFVLASSARPASIQGAVELVQALQERRFPIVRAVFNRTVPPPPGGRAPTWLREPESARSRLDAALDGPAGERAGAALEAAVALDRRRRVEDERVARVTEHLPDSVGVAVVPDRGRSLRGLPDLVGVADDLGFPG